MKQKKNITYWLTALSSFRRFDKPLINHIEYDYRRTFIEVHKKSKYIAYTTSAGPIESCFLDKKQLKQKDNDPEDEAYYLYTVNLSISVMGVASAKRTISKVVDRFIENFGYMRMNVYVIQQNFKSSGDVNISVVVADTEFEKK